MKRRTYLALFLTLVLSMGAAFLNMTAFLNGNAKAESFQSAQSVSFTFDPSLTVTQTTSTVAINSLTPGTYNNSNINYVTVTSNAVGGYSLISNVTGNGASTTQLRITPTSDTYKFTSLTSNKASLSSFTDNYWGYSYCIGNSSTCTASAGTWISGNTGSTSTGYNGYASTSTNITHVSTSASGTSTIGYKIGARASSTQAAGTYTNKVVFTAAAKVITTSYTINYNSNGGTSVSSQSGTSTTGAVQLSSTVPTKSDYVFRGWCTVDNTSDPTTCTGTNAEIIQAGNLLGLNTASSSVTKTLYAVWKSNTAPLNPYCIDAATCMQTSTACDTTLTDGRDGATYTTATIAGSCWMTQNLRFQGTDLKVGESDVTSDITMTYGQLTSGDSYTEPRIATGSTTDYGTYYNYCAASAGEVCDDTTQQDATRSVCPAGWKLPTQAQLNAVPSKDSHFTASSGLAGLYDGGSLVNAGTYGFWWASTAYDATIQYFLGYISDDFWGVDGYYKYGGFSARCVRAS